MATPAPSYLRPAPPPSAGQTAAPQGGGPGTAPFVPAPPADLFRLGQTRGELVEGVVRRYLRLTGTSWEGLGLAVAEAYARRVPGHLARISWPSGGDVHRRGKLAGQTLRRQLDPGEQGPADLDLYDALLEVLPAGWRWRLVVAMGERDGLLPVQGEPAPASAPGGDAVALGNLLREVGEAIAALGPLVADGVVDSRDRPALPAVLEELAEAQAAIGWWQARLRQAAGEG